MTRLIKRLQLASGTVDTTGGLADGIVTSAKLADSGITQAKLAPAVVYRGRYDADASTRRAGATATTEVYYTARVDGDGLAENEVSDEGAGERDTINRTLYFSDKFDADPDTPGDWTAYTTQPAGNATFSTARAALFEGLNHTDATANTRGTIPLSLKMERTVT